ncbi:MAG: Rrf2 family protein [Planctomycetota bacterium]|jgi:Rrf2 family protein
MLQFTKRTEYGLIALVHLADREGELVSAREIGEQYPVPRRLLAEVLKDLGRAGLIDSQRGATGGYRLARPAIEIDLASIVAALEGSPLLIGCQGSEALIAETNVPCELSPLCRIRSPLTRLRDNMMTMLRETTLSTLSESTIQDAASEVHGAHSVSPEPNASLQ